MKIINELKKQSFLFSELVKRDFKKKYKGTYLGMLWSILSPLLSLLIMSLVFTHFFDKSQPHFTIYIFCGNIIFSFFTDSTNGGMGSLLANSQIFTKVNVPKYLFLFSRNVSALINFALTFIVFVIFCIIDKIKFTPACLMLFFPILCLIIFNIGVLSPVVMLPFIIVYLIFNFITSVFLLKYVIMMIVLWSILPMIIYTRKKSLKYSFHSLTYSLFSLIFLLWIPLYAILTLNNNKWLTRK